MEYFRLNDKQNLINLNGRKAIFKNNILESFDDNVRNAAKKLVGELALRNYDVPGFDILFGINTDTAEVEVFTIKNKDLDLRIVDTWEIMIPMMEVCIHDDRSGSLEIYTGSSKNWNEDKANFSNSKFQAKEKYDLRQGGFVSESDSSHMSMLKIEKKLIKYLNTVIDIVQTFPVADPIELFVEPEHVQLENELLKDSVFYAITSSRNEEETVKGIEPNHRLLRLGLHSTTHKKDSIMNDGYVYMEIKKPGDACPIKAEDTKFYNYGGGLYDKRTFLIKPKNYNSFYVVDGDVFDRHKKAWCEANPNERYLSDEIVNEFTILQAETMVPVNEYKGGYVKPILITNRRIWPDELELMTVEKVEEVEA